MMLFFMLAGFSAYLALGWVIVFADSLLVEHAFNTVFSKPLVFIFVVVFWPLTMTWAHWKWSHP